MASTYMGPHPERIELLAQALESGTFKQGGGQLTKVRDDGTEADCCLGVACKVASANGLELRRAVGIEGEVEYGYLAHAAFMPVSVMSWYGFATESGEYSEGSLARQNDAGASFAEIARILRTTPDLYVNP